MKFSLFPCMLVLVVFLFISFSFLLFEIYWSQLWWFSFSSISYCHCILLQEVLLWIKSVVDECGENVSTEQLKEYIWKTLNSGKVHSSVSYITFLVNITVTHHLGDSPRDLISVISLKKNTVWWNSLLGLTC